MDPSIDPVSIDWTDPAAQVTENFTVHEACWLPSWGQLHQPTPEEQVNLIRTCELMEQVRSKVGGPIIVHVMIRPAAYNAQIGGAPHSAHIAGLACDFSVPGRNCDDIRIQLIPWLDLWEARMENAPRTNWVHVDLAPVPPGGRRFFIP